jgi:hypothetical protein
MVNITLRNAERRGTFRIGVTIATPLPGGFCGGWITPNVAGLVKGEPGAMHW